MADEILAYSSFVKTIPISRAPNLGWEGNGIKITRFVSIKCVKVNLPFVGRMLNRIERDVVQSSDQQQWQLRQAHADHEQHRAEEQDQRGPHHDEPERGSADQREHHHDERGFVFCTAVAMCEEVWSFKAFRLSQPVLVPTTHRFGLDYERHMM